MADRKAIASVSGLYREVSTSDDILLGGVKNSGGTINVTATTAAFGATNLTISGTVAGIASTDLVDKSAAEDISGLWTFQRGADGISLIAKAASALSANGSIFEVQDSAGATLFKIDKEGDMTVQGSETIVGSTTFQGNTTFGDAITDTVEFVARLASGTDLIPIADSVSDLGTAALRFQAAYVDTVETAHLHSADGAVDVNGEALTLESGAGGAASATAGGVGGTYSILGGAGGAGTAALAAGAGAAVTLAGGAAGADNGGGGAAGGGLTLRGGAGTNGTNGTLTIGATNTASVEMGAASIAVNINGALTVDGNVTLGDAATDTVTFTADVASNILPDGDGTRNLGEAASRWLQVFADTVGDSAQVLTLAGGLSVSADAAHTINLVDNSGVALDIQQGSDNYLLIDTTNTAEAMSFGNAVTNPSFTFLGSGAVNVTGTLNADGNLTVDGNTTLGNAATDTVTFTADVASNILPDGDGTRNLGEAASRWLQVFADTFGDSAQVTTIAGGISVSADAAHTINLIDNSAGALDIQQGSDNYILIATSNGTEKISTGNAVTNPDLEHLGTGDVILSNGTLDVPAGTSYKIGGVALTTANYTAANVDTLLDGSNADALHTHASAVATDLTDTGFTTTGVATGALAYASANDTVLAAIATAESTAQVVGVVTAAGSVTHAGIVDIIGDDVGTPAAGTTLFLSAATAGRWTATATTTSTEVQAPIGIVIDNTGYAGAGSTVAVRLNIKPTLLNA